MLLLLLALQAHAGPECPDYVAEIDRAEDAVRQNDLDALYGALDATRVGLACGPVLDNPLLQARFWLARAALLDAYGDRGGADDALFAAWRSNPAASIAHLPQHLRQRYAAVVERVPEEASFRLQPIPDPGSVVYVDGVALQVAGQSTTAGTETPIRTQAGLHIIQVTKDALDETATSARVRNLPPDTTSVFDINDPDLLTPPSSTPIQLPDDLSSPASKGCGGRRR